jgi:hypothetical protein
MLSIRLEKTYPSGAFSSIQKSVGNQHCSLLLLRMFPKGFLLMAKPPLPFRLLAA